MKPIGRGEKNYIINLLIIYLATGIDLGDGDDDEASLKSFFARRWFPLCRILLLLAFFDPPSLPPSSPSQQCIFLGDYVCAL